MKRASGSGGYAGRRRLVVVLALLGAAALAARALFLQVVQQEMLQGLGADRYLRTVVLPANRGTITDRRNEPLAISTPVSAVGADPGALLQDRSGQRRLAALLGMSPEQLHGFLEARRTRRYVVLRPRVDPSVAEAILHLKARGVDLRPAVHRYYPAAEVTAHLLGFTDIDDHGLEGIELGFEEHLRGIPGAKRVIQDASRRVVEDVEAVRPARPGRDLALSIDKRVQYVAYRELKAAVQAHRARGGSIVVLDARSGEVLALVNQPSYNPNNRGQSGVAAYRNRALTDLFEPGSTVKPFTVAAALEAGACLPQTRIDTRPGYLKVGRHTVRDLHNYGVLAVSEVVSKSSNVGMTKLALGLEPAALWGVFSRLGFGATTQTGFPGEASGQLNDYRAWRTIDQATLSFGYGLSVTTLQLARAYQALAAEGVLVPVSLLRRTQQPSGRRVLDRGTALRVRAMLEAAVSDGTGTRAAVPGYRVAGKTGTVHKTTAHGGYEKARYISLFAGMIPTSAPRLVGIIKIDEPAHGKHFGGDVAAPVFSALMREATRLLDIAPDHLDRAIPPSGGYLAGTQTVRLKPPTVP